MLLCILKIFFIIPREPRQKNILVISSYFSKLFYKTIQMLFTKILLVLIFLSCSSIWITDNFHHSSIVAISGLPLKFQIIFCFLHSFHKFLYSLNYIISKLADVSICLHIENLNVTSFYNWKCKIGNLFFYSSQRLLSLLPIFVKS